MERRRYSRLKIEEIDLLPILDNNLEAHDIIEDFIDELDLEEREFACNRYGLLDCEISGTSSLRKISKNLSISFRKARVLNYNVRDKLGKWFINRYIN